MQNYIKSEPIANFPNIVANVRRYVQLASRCIGTVARRAPYRTLWRSGCFCTRGALQGYDVIC